MAKKSKLKMALAAEKGVDFKKLKLKKIEKIAKSRNSKTDSDVKPPEEIETQIGDAKNNKNYKGNENGESRNTTSSDKDGNGKSQKTTSSNKDEESNNNVVDSPVESPLINKSGCDSFVENNSSESSDDDEDIPLSELEDLDEEEKEDLIPHQRLTINNTIALNAALKRISLPISELPFSEHQSITTSVPVSIPDVSDDFNRELAFYAQALSAVQQARGLLKNENIPFSRPKDYFAEMVKPDEHMEKIKSKLIEEAASKKASAEAKKQRDLKKFGKQVQIAKLQERDKERKQALEKIKLLKRKRQGTTAENTNEADLFDVAVDEEIGSMKPSREKRVKSNRHQKKDEKFGFGGKKRFKKSGDALSSGDLKGFSSKKMKAGAKKRPGKARRAAQR